MSSQVGKSVPVLEDDCLEPRSRGRGLCATDWYVPKAVVHAGIANVLKMAREGVSS